MRYIITCLSEKRINTINLNDIDLDLTIKKIRNIYPNCEIIRIKVINYINVEKYNGD